MRAILPLVLLLLVARVASAVTFTVGDIRVEGLQRISAGTVFNYLPIDVGDTVGDTDLSRSVKELYKTGFFKDVELLRENDVLVVSVKERPSIAAIEFSGNESIETKALEESLKQIGLAEGRVFNRSLLDKVEQDLQRQYFSRGKYGVRIETTVTPLERNRVSIRIDIAEGEVARIRQINIVGNETYADEELKDEFTLSPPTLLSFYTKNDQYSKQKLSGDLEALRSYYLNRGYVDFKIDSTQVSLTPDKKHIYITINITEGAQYEVAGVELSGDLVVPREELQELIKIEEGQIFARKDVSETSNAITDRLGNEGFAFANVNSIPKVDKETKTVELTFFVDPGRRVYVRRVYFEGNYRTQDVVLRREVRQMEGGWFSTDRVQLSKRRLDRLGYFREVTVQTPSVPGKTDQVDVKYSVKEQLSGNLRFGVGYGQTQGVTLSAGVSENNFLGTGKRVSAQVNTSDVNEVADFTYTNPYHTINGVSRTLGFTYRTTDAEQANIGSYNTDVANVRVKYGVPLAEFDTLRYGIELEQTGLNTNDSSPDVVFDFIDRHGEEYNIAKLTSSWERDTRNRAILANEGVVHRLSGALAGGDLTFYKLGYDYKRYFAITESLTLALDGGLAFGDGIGNTENLPFFENYFAGGPRSVRGYRQNTLGPEDMGTGDPIGGNLRAVGSAEVIVPAPFELGEQFRLSAFVDGGNVFSTEGDNFNFRFSDLRYSAGVSAMWISPLGALTFSLAQPLNDEPDDDTEVFQFSLGSPF